MTAGYRRSAGSPRGAARKQELLELVTEDLAVNGLVDFSLRRAARAAGTTHKVLLYHFEGAEDLLRQAVFRLRQRRIDNALAAVAVPGGGLAAFVRTVWPTLVAEETGLQRVLDQAMGLAMHDPDRHRDLGREASGQYLPVLMAACPAGWSESRKRGMAAMVLATLRGFLLERLVGDVTSADAGFDALVTLLEAAES
ncbi:TetR/AcrR family transcriptional regulator [Kutzneria kofuensis]|uniref:AcrR family transcriptional regulator n=1 Tax=Kutzneria kofuensis TaxID=103725 RepID=A0A7W9KNK0_9PSEU|nr:TetR/AcrR family transcriptional regulator [Kutzneria kofuensis]MBB5895860.1 AcrR family transcriptional regulator [Kutzneria kofuensis]